MSDRSNEGGGRGLRDGMSNPADDLILWAHDKRRTDPVWRAPLEHTGDPENGMWHLFRYADIERVLADPATFSSELTRVLPADEKIPLVGEGSLTTVDPPRHRRLRGLVSKAFTPRMVAGLEPRITALTKELLHGVNGEVELVADLAYPLPVIVIAELLGVPVEDRELFKRWADRLLSVAFEITDTAAMEKILPDFEEMVAYLTEKARLRRAAPTGDLLSRLVTAEVEGERLSDSDVVDFAGLLLLAGHVTTTALLTNAAISLTETPEAEEELRANPGAIPDALEEVLRYRPPLTRTYRVTTKETAFGEATVPADQVITLWLISANRDEERFPNADRFDIHRERPIPHLGFGHGIHFCLGAPLARLESRIALGALLERLPGLRVTGEPEFYAGNEVVCARRMTLTAGN